MYHNATGTIPLCQWYKTKIAHSHDMVLGSFQTQKSSESGIHEFDQILPIASVVCCHAAKFCLQSPQRLVTVFSVHQSKYKFLSTQDFSYTQSTTL